MVTAAAGGLPRLLLPRTHRATLKLLRARRGTVCCRAAHGTGHELEVPIALELLGTGRHSDDAERREHGVLPHEVTDGSGRPRAAPFRASRGSSRHSQGPRS